MSISTENLARMEAFSREHARRHLENAELQYLAEIERARRATQGAAGLSGQSLEDAQADLMEYMADCMEGLLAGGCDEDEALEQVMASLAAEELSPETQALRQQYSGYFEDEGLSRKVISHYEDAIVVGCIAMGGLTGMVMAWRGLLDSWFWAIAGGIIIGALFGVAFSNLVQGAMLQQLNRKRR